MAKLEHEFNYYQEHREELLRLYEGKFVVIRGNQLLGAYDSELDAIRETSATYPLGTFLVQKCEAGDDSLVQMFYSGVAFA